jgi:hypothetical protein
LYINNYTPGKSDKFINKQLIENTEKWMNWFKSRLNVLKGKDDDTASTASLTDDDDDDEDI